MRVVALTLAVAGALTGCGRAPGAHRGTTVEITGFLFKPARVEIAAGASVRWHNADDIHHTVRSGTPDDPSGAFDSGDVALDEAVTLTFVDRGTHAYFCDNHRGMRGEVVAR